MLGVGTENTELILPELRQDLQLLESETLISGQPAWLIYDPVTMRHHQISDRIMMALSHWHRGDVGRVIAASKIQTNEPLTLEELERLIAFLYENQLTLDVSEKAKQAFSSSHFLGGKNIFSWAIHNYLFVRIPLFRPDKFLTATLRIARFFGSRFALATIFILSALGIFLVSRNWADFLGYAEKALSLQGALSYAIALVFVKSLHELGHAYFAAHRKLRVPAMGLAFMVMAPFLYSDVSEAWRLKSRKQRILIDCAGIIVELSLAGIATLLWALWPDGAVRSALFFVATTSWVMSLFVNLNPFMRFDGYYILTDLLGVANLQSRSFALAKWTLREMLFGLNDPIPEPMPLVKRRFLVFYAWFVWVYRFFLFLGIAVLVYATFFKALGILLFIIEILWFIILPIWKELQLWWERRDDIMTSKRLWLPVMLTIGFGFLFFFPFWNSVTAPALLTSANKTPIYAPIAGQLKESHFAKGDTITAGEKILSLHSPQLEQQLDATQKRFQLLETRSQLIGADEFNRTQNLIIQTDLQATTLERNALQKQIQSLTISAPHSGSFAQFDAALKDDLWIAEGQEVGVIIDKTTPEVRVLIQEDEAKRLIEGASATFIPTDPARSRIELKNPRIAKTASRTISEPLLTSLYGGTINVVEGKDGALIAQKGYVELIFTAPVGSLQDRDLQGIVDLKVEAQSLIQKIIKQIARVLIREIN